MELLKAIEYEISQYREMEKKMNDIGNLIHITYYEKMFPHDRRAIDRTRLDYPLFLLIGIIENKQWV